MKGTRYGKLTWKHYTGLILLLGIGAVLYYYFNTSFFAIYSEEFYSFVYSLGWKAPLFMIGLMIVEVVLAPLPGGWLAIAMGFLFGPWLGFVYSFSASLTGAWIAFELARKFGQPFVQHLVKQSTMDAWADKIHNSRFGIIGLYAIPLFPVDIISLLLGLTHLSRQRFIVLAGIGLLPNMFLLNFFGHVISKPTYQYVLIILVVVSCLYLFYSWLRKRSANTTHAIPTSKR